MSDARPKRVQRKRTNGWKMPLDTVYVGRPTKWGNPFKLGLHQTRENLLKDYRFWLLDNQYGFAYIYQGTAISELRGKNLACWCPLTDKDGKPVPCHADVLLELANQ